MPPARSHRTTRLHREATRHEIAVATGLSGKQVVEIQKAGCAVTSLDKPIGDEQATLGELMAAQQPGPQEEVEQNIDRETLREALVESRGRANRARALRDGFAADAEPQTVNQVVGSLKITRHRACQLEEHGLTQLATQRGVQALRGGW
jgi:DNA-directed RNA polymerase sigma subunit (sigma70/sigma32)